MIELPLSVELEVEEDEYELSIDEDSDYEMEVDTEFGEMVEDYEGLYTVSPSNAKITLPTKGLRCTDDITVEAKKNIQFNFGTSGSASPFYGSVILPIKVEKTANYNIHWTLCAHKNSSSSVTAYSHLNIAGSESNEKTTTRNSSVTVENVRIYVNQTVGLQAKVSGSGYASCSNLIIEEV